MVKWRHAVVEHTGHAGGLCESLPAAMARYPLGITAGYRRMGTLQDCLSMAIYNNGAALIGRCSLFPSCGRCRKTQLLH